MLATVTQKARNVFRGLVQRYGSGQTKRRLWNGEFSAGRWNFLDATGDESIHVKIEQYANNGHVLDLGCGTGTTGLELNPALYRFYTGVDVSDIAVQKAASRARDAGRENTNAYVQCDIETYVPARPCNVILFGESIYYIPSRKILDQLTRYSRHLTPDGVFLVRIFDVSARHRPILDIIEKNFSVVDKHLHPSQQGQVCVIVFRPH